MYSRLEYGTREESQSQYHFQCYLVEDVEDVQKFGSDWEERAWLELGAEEAGEVALASADPMRRIPCSIREKGAAKRSCKFRTQRERHCAQDIQQSLEFTIYRFTRCRNSME